MKKSLFFCMYFLTMGFLANATVWPTEVVVVEPDAGINTGALNEAVRQYGGTKIYELKRGGTYILNAEILPTFPIYIRAQQGTGARPILQPGVDATGVSTGLFRFSGDVILENLYLTGVDEMNKLVKNIIRISQPNLTIKADRCYFDYDAASTFRIEGKDCSFTFSNCTFRNNMDLLSPSNGRPIDTRGNAVTLMSFENCTFYNLSSTFIRTANAAIKSFILNQNTIYTNAGGVSFQYAQNVVATNNIFYNCGFDGATSATGGLFTLDSIKTSVVGMTDAQRTIDFRNNLVYREKRFDDIMKLGTSCTNIMYLPVLFNETALKFIATGQMKIEGLREEAVAFKNAPLQGIDYIAFRWGQCMPSTLVLGTGQQMPVFAADENPNLVGEATGSSAYNFSYPYSSPIATASLTNGPLGDLNWMPAQTGLKSLKKDLNANVIIRNKTMVIDFMGLESSQYDLKIYNITGKLIANQSEKIFDGKQTNLSLNTMAQGVYIYSLIAGNSVQTGKFVIQ